MGVLVLLDTVPTSILAAMSVHSRFGIRGIVSVEVDKAFHLMLYAGRMPLADVSKPGLSVPYTLRRALPGPLEDALACQALMQSSRESKVTHHGVSKPPTPISKIFHKCREK